MSIRSILAAMFAASFCSSAFSANVWINEIHYDNDGADENEFVELAGTAGVDLDGWTLLLYNGSNGTTYASMVLSGVLGDENGTGFGALAFSFDSIQNGGPDGVALADADGGLVQLLSYEGQFVASTGPATGATSIDVGVFESTTTPVGHSLQLVGSGNSVADFVWSGPESASPGLLNNDQQLTAVPLPAALPMFAGALAVLGMGAARRRSERHASTLS